LKKNQQTSLSLKNLFLLFFALILAGCSTNEDKMTQELKTFITNFESKAASAYKDYSLAYFNATISGKTDDYNKS